LLIGFFSVFVGAFSVVGRFAAVRFLGRRFLRFGVRRLPSGVGRLFGFDDRLLAGVFVVRGSGVVRLAGRFLFRLLY
jgi:hypothetical protein